MTSNWWTDTSRANWVDYAISWFGSALAAFSCGQAVGSNTVSGIGLALVTIGTLLSYLARTLGGEKKWTATSGALYAVAAWVAILTVSRLNEMAFEPETFPRELLPSSWLFWMLSFGSLFLWRDGVLIFHSIPSLAMFGFVGCYDTFRPVVVLFFIFLVCFAILFARAHAREMQVRAVESGYFGLISKGTLEPSHQSELLREGPWRWAAGAESAIGSALVIVLLSAIGAPVIQASSKGFAGRVPIRPPRLRQQVSNPAATPTLGQLSQVATGPVDFQDTPYFEIQGDVPEYLRIGTYNRWTGSAWMSTPNTDPNSVRDRLQRAVVQAANPEFNRKQQLPNMLPGQLPSEYRTQKLSVASLVRTDELPQAGNSIVVTGPDQLRFDAGGSASLSTPSRYTLSLAFDLVAVDKARNAPKLVSGTLWPYLQNANLTPRLAALAKEVTSGLKSDAEKVERIRYEVSQRIRYNIRAAAVPRSVDAAENAVFEVKEGYCDVFATAVVQMARAVDVPCRYTVGYLVDPRNRNSVGTQILLDSDRHAWAEAYFENVGWVPFDATAGAKIVPGGERKKDPNAKGISTAKILEWALNIGIVVALAGGGWALYRAKTLEPTSKQIRAELDKHYLILISTMWRVTGQRRLLSETTSEYIRRIEPKLGECADDALLFGERFTSMMFRQEPASTEEVAKLGSEVQDFCKRLRAMKSVK